MADIVDIEDVKVSSGRQSQQTFHSTGSCPAACPDGGARSVSQASGGGAPEPTATPPPVRAGKGLSLWMAAVFIMGEMCGSGMLSLPYALTHMGFMGAPLIGLIGLGSGYCACCLARCWVLLENRHPELRGQHTQQPLSDIAFHCLGKPGRIFAAVCMCINTFGTCIVYVLIVAQMLQALLGGHIQMHYCIWILVLSVALVPPTWFGSPKDIRGIGVMALATTVLAWLLSMGQLAVHFDTLHQNATFTQPGFLPFFLGIGPILYSYGGACTLPTIQIDMINREHFTYSVMLGYLGSVLLFAPLAALGYAASGDQVEKNILQTLKLHTPGVEPAAAEIIFIVHLLTAFFVILNPFAQQMEALAGIPHKFSLRRLVFRTGLMGLLVVLGETIPDFIELIQLLGSTTIATTAFILPSLMYILLARQSDPEGRWTSVPVPLWEKCVLLTMALLGIVVGITSTVMTTQEIIQYGLDSSCLINTGRSE
ncbi:amino acid transporter AVT1J-like isoform X2 [Amphibalanus amphitrite]|uniref:amino acid transporter AVT1J-like isoform X2 n=1 Tax=Amphibalanus amphitrite TaxID=1232801 RepID=UPI001C90E9DD|nr:amino acid transporter AVT1J-like isoform X2 [Amphibalanus amphitrite]XP_043219817.1 amino acid transporter AVT1J-like isoform X2 [Amphibalanus amphitrite]XP_043219818.1 amino acid transporter AVT1J-like isoform X2 [Amphibalanus amphitrite]XP_043219819.1 amino acid transporter AVT1J-like isoform X2 [Amphibalanus amphitrite]